MKQVVTKGIVLSRTNYGEADRIVTMLTPDCGKVRLMAKGVRKIKSKLAGGIELFSTSSITYLPGKRQIGTLISCRLEVHFSNIPKAVDRTLFAYQCLKKVNQLTEDAAGGEYYQLLLATLQALDETTSLPAIELWFGAQLLYVAGVQPNLQTDASGQPLDSQQRYQFSIDQMSFEPAQNGPYNASHIKLLRLAFQLQKPQQLDTIVDVTSVIGPALQLMSLLLRHRQPT